MLRKCWFLLVLLLVSLCLPPGCAGEETAITPAAPDGVVAFPDLGLEVAIREAMDKPAGDIYRYELESLTELQAQDAHISDISGIQYCGGLTRLYMGGNQISDISLLASLTSLAALHLEGNRIGDISPLASLTSLTELYLYGNQIRDISPLASLTSLSRLFLGRNQIRDISLLSSLTHLTALHIGSNPVSDISPLLKNPGLGSGDQVWVLGDSLDMHEGSEDVKAIRTLQGWGVDVTCDPVL